ncbi:AI-2E family transporter [Halieaceae bacterium IMCC14734]|uniref:AI-2E family transporter n=1 Tax=Candidatus Litorirhabdus singularis TaxID=2518993 RepID=A0ABT3TLS9_9GAMM|nr:AI-2E family transporter [Candidatus Litorirhabdus singularis]MCX2983250.1 AI-2E family transporter [Candidatus Litorirhabdus singularis]
MLDIFQKWYERYFFEEESILLLVLLGVALALLLTIGDIMSPILASIVLAFLMQGLATRLIQMGLPQSLAVIASYLVFVGFFFGFMLVLMPLVWRQLLSLFAELPRMVEQGRALLQVLPEQYPHLVSAQQIADWVALAQAEIGQVGQTVLSFSLASIPLMLTILIYLILVPLLVFFLLKDRELILGWLGGFLPHERPLLTRIWREMNEQVANYARGKVIEILIVGAVSYVAFTWLDLRYAALLALLVGLSVIIPYIGATVVTLPVFFIGLFQWGFSTELFYLMLVYGVIQALDGNVLVPLLFSEAVNLHPVAIILAVVFFGGVWGLWGVFFAIPLATLVKAVINAWPRPTE